MKTLSLNSAVVSPMSKILEFRSPWAVHRVSRRFGISTAVLDSDAFSKHVPSIVHFNSHHTLATVDLLVSTVNNPTAFANFSSTLAKSFFQVRCHQVSLLLDKLQLTPASFS